MTAVRPRARAAVLVAGAATALVAWGAASLAPSTAPAARPPDASVAGSLARAASHPEGLALTPERTATQPVTGLGHDLAGHRTTVQGCLLDYGRDGACLPAVPPDAADMGMDELEMPWTCAQVRRLLPAGIAVAGTDVLRLDRDRDGTACGPSDAR